MLKNLANYFGFEIRSVANPTPEEAAVLAAGWGAGVAGNAAGALYVPAVQCAIRLLSEAVACLDIKVMRRDGEAESEDKAHPIALLFASQPNDWSSTYEMIRDMVATALTTDAGGLIFVNRVNGEVRELIHYAAGTYTIQYSTDGRQEPNYRIGDRIVSAADVIHLRSPFDRCPLTLAAGAINVSRLLERHAEKLFSNGARPSGVIKFPKPLGDEGLKKMKAGWKEAHEGAENSGKTAILWDGAEWISMAMVSTDAQFLENRAFQIVEIARAFRVPPSMLYDMDRATWSNAEQMGREFLVYSLEPWLKALEGAMLRALFTKEERGEYRIIFDRDDLTRASLTERATAISSLISSKVLSPNQARGWLDLAPYTGGDEYGNPHINPTAPGVGHNGGPPIEDGNPEPKSDDA